MSDTNEFETIDEALEFLNGRSGQAYVTDEDAYNALVPFYLKDADWYPPMDEDDFQVLPDEAVYQIGVHPSEARGIVTIKQYRMAVLISDLSAFIAEQIDEEGVGESGQYVGGGFSADARHEDTMAFLNEHYDYEPEDD